MTSQERDLLALPVAFPHIPFQNTKLCSAPLVSPRLRDPFTRTPNLDFFFCVCVREALERLALLHRFSPFFPLAGVVLANSSVDIAFTELQSKLNRSKIYSPSPLRYHQSPHVCPHILRGGTSLLSPAERFSEIRQVQRTWTPSPTPKNLSPKDI